MSDDKQDEDRPGVTGGIDGIDVRGPPEADGDGLPELPPPDWTPYTEDPAWHAWYRKDFDRRYGRSFDDPEDVCATAVERLLFGRLPRAHPRSRDKLDGYVRTAFRSICIDLYREHYKRPRVPTRMKPFGPPITLIFDLFCLRRMHENDIAEELQLSLPSVREWVYWLKKEDKCPKRAQVRSITGADPDEPSKDMDLPDPSGDDPTSAGAEDEETAALLAWLLTPHDGPAKAEASLGESLRGRLDGIRSTLTLDDDERLMLRMEFVEELPLKEMAPLLGFEIHTLRRRRAALFERVRKGFGGLGLEGTE